MDFRVGGSSDVILERHFRPFHFRAPYIYSW